MVIAALIKEFQLSSELNQMKGIVPDDILEALKKKKLGLPGIDTEVVTPIAKQWRCSSDNSSSSTTSATIAEKAIMT